ncbi:hypothetical protein [Urbifossiella limnaea]|uniref:Uncharacterized protein n=1 Tax=Urbifossiella limnaea TaxID=2528023 RepID=A0A517XXL4_9BACT|nr:hypothetical protein [Urbifossiella limnaea]QDU22252.1 hypothetical protein ETAA1_42290 [Urbifossiella limnaea]
MRADGWNSLDWVGLVFREVAGTLDMCLPRDDHEELIAALRGMIREFLAYRAEHAG